MKSIKLTQEEIETMSYTDVAELILKSNKKKMNIQDLFKAILESMNLPESYFESKIGDFFGLISTDKRFAMVEKGFWDLRTNTVQKIVIEDEEDEEELEVEDIEENLDDEENVDDDIDYDETLDDDDEDDLKDLVIIDGEEDTDAM